MAARTRSRRSAPVVTARLHRLRACCRQSDREIAYLVRQAKELGVDSAALREAMACRRCHQRVSLIRHAYESYAL